MATSSEPAAPRRPKVPLDQYEKLLAGGGAGALAKTVTAPLDRIKLLYQVDPRRVFTFGDAARRVSRIASETGFLSLWRGNGLAMIHVIPYGALVYMTFDNYHELLVDNAGVSALPARFIAGAGAGASATVVAYPLDLLRARVMAHSGPTDKYPLGMLSALLDISRREGIHTLWRGLSPTMIGIVPYAGISFSIFETSKVALKDLLGLTSDSELPTVLRLSSGAVAGVVAQSVTYPLHVVRRRMQVIESPVTSSPMAAAPGEVAGGHPTAAEAAASGARALSARHYQSLPRALFHIARTEGIRNGLFKGLMLTWMKAPLTTAIGFTVNDKLKELLRSRRPQLEATSEALASLGATHPTAAGAAPAEGRPQPPASIYHERRAQLSSVELLAAGSLAGACAKTVIAPADRIKIIFQTDPARPFSFGQAMRAGQEIVNTSGVLALWRGNGATMVRIMPHAGIVYMCFDKYNTSLSAVLPETSAPHQRFLAGAAAGATATALTYPLDLMRARMAIDMSRDGSRYASMLHAGRSVVQHEGWRALYAGITPTLIGVMPYAGLSFMCFETLKATIRQRWEIKSDRDMPTSVRLAAGGLAGLLAQSATYPLDIVRRRMQVARSGGDAGREAWTALMRRILVEEGLIRGLYKGLSMNWLKSPIAIAVSFTVNDSLKYKLLASHEEAAGR